MSLIPDFARALNILISRALYRSSPVVPIFNARVLFRDNYSKQWESFSFFLKCHIKMQQTNLEIDARASLKRLGIVTFPPLSTRAANFSITIKITKSDNK